MNAPINLTTAQGRNTPHMPDKRRDTRRCDANWIKRLHELEAFVAQQGLDDQGNCVIPYKNATEGQRRLYRWLIYQRRKFRQGQLSGEQIQQLTALGVSFNNKRHNDQLWLRRYHQLIAHHATHGSLNVPYKDNPVLASWIMKQRHLKRAGRLQAKRIEALTAIGFSWNHKFQQIETGWKARFEQLVAFKARHGHTLVSAQDSSYSELARWVSEQRSTFNNNRMPAERHEKLTRLGFVWSIHDMRWEERFIEAKAYLQQHRTLTIHDASTQHAELREWVRRQRYLFKKGQLHAQRIERLTRIGFSFDPREDAWQGMYQRLLDYHDRAHSFHIPSNDRHHRDLANWMRRQRKDFRDGVIDKDRLAKLDAIGFPWFTARGRPSPAKITSSDLSKAYHNGSRPLAIGC